MTAIVIENDPQLPSHATLPPSLSYLIARLQVTKQLTPESVKRLVLEANISSADLLPWADFDHPIADSYGRKLVFWGGHFEVMVMSWLPGDFSAIHDHGATQWGAVQCFGAAEHYVYQLSDDVLSTRATAHYTPGMVRAVDRDLIHQMGNAGTEPFLSLHVYGCAEPQGTITGDARIFDLLEGTIQYTDGGVFFHLPEEHIKRRQSPIRGDRATTRRHHQQMRDRLQRILAAKFDPIVMAKLSLL